MEDQHPEQNPAPFEVGGDRHDDLFTVLSQPRRRFTLQYLRTSDTPLPVAELISELVAWENGQSETSTPGDHRAAVEISLLHCHLPMMAEAGVVRYDRIQKTVALGDRTDGVRAHLQVVTSE